MADNRVFITVGPLLRQTTLLMQGLHLHEVTLKVAQNKEVDVRTDRTALNNEQKAFVATRTAKSKAGKAVQAFIKQTMPELLTARNLLIPHLGREHALEWQAAGWTHGTLQFPRDPDELALLLETLADYLTAHESYENAPLNFTAARIGELYAQLDALLKAELSAQSANVAAKKARDAALQTLYKRASNLISELRWYDFGLVPPALMDAPGAIRNFVLHPGMTPDSVLLDWLDADLAEGYHVYMKQLDADEPFLLKQTVHDSDATVSGLVAETTVWFMVRAVNEHGEGPASAVLEYAVPA